jgi:hypothetical protein
VIGNLSLRQFLVLLIGVSILLVLYFILEGPLRFLFWLLAIIIGSATFAFAFVKYGDQKLEVFVMSALSTFTNPRQRVWKKDLAQEETPDPVAKAPEAQKAPQKTLAEAKNDLETLANLVDSGGYSKLDSKDRLVGAEVLRVDDSGAKDIIAKAESDDEELDKMIEAASIKAVKHEPLISEAASIKPGQDFDYPKIELAGNDPFKDQKISKY